MGIKQTGERIRAIRFRTWVITAVQVIALVLLLFVVLGWKEFSLIDFILLSVIQIITHLSYFPDGENFGSKDPLLVKTECRTMTRRTKSTRTARRNYSVNIAKLSLKSAKTLYTE